MKIVMDGLMQVSLGEGKQSLKQRKETKIAKLF